MRYAARIERVRLATVASIGPVSHQEWRASQSGITTNTFANVSPVHAARVSAQATDASLNRSDAVTPKINMRALDVSYRKDLLHL
jgi:hypothetical protein